MKDLALKHEMDRLRKQAMPSPGVPDWSFQPRIITRQELAPPYEAFIRQEQETRVARGELGEFAFTPDPSQVFIVVDLVLGVVKPSRITDDAEVYPKKVLELGRYSVASLVAEFEAEKVKQAAAVPKVEV